MFVIKFRNGKTMEVRIKDGLISEISYKGEYKEILCSRNETEDIKKWLKDILKADLESFKNIVRSIEYDEEFSEYAKDLLNCEKDKKVKIFVEYKKEYERKLNQMLEEIKKYEI